MMRMFAALLILVAINGQAVVGALEITVSPEKPPAAGTDMSGGVVMILETGEVTPLPPDGHCSLPVVDCPETMTLEVYVPGYVPAVRTCGPDEEISIYLPLQAFEAETVVIDLGLEASQAVAARKVSRDAAEEAAEAPPPASTDGPSLEPALGFNPFVIIEVITGKSIPEILGLDD